MTTPSIPSPIMQTPTVSEPVKLAPVSPTHGNSEADAAHFVSALASAPSLPEHHLLSATGKLASATDHLAQRALLDARTLDDPIRMLDTQRQMSERVLTLDVVAKVAGAVTQGVNKLVHMQ